MVSVGGQPCLSTKVVVPEYEIKCTLPPFVPSFSNQHYRQSRAAMTGSARGSNNNHDDLFDELEAALRVEVSVTLADLPLLSSSTFDLLSYTVAAPLMLAPTLSNLAARSVDVSWVPPGNVWDQLTVTGYVVRVRELASGNGRMEESLKDVALGNVTTTTITGLLPATTYAFSVASVCENHTNSNSNSNFGQEGQGAKSGNGEGNGAEWTKLDLYGRRQFPLQHGSVDTVISGLSVEANLTATLKWDLELTQFNANGSLVNHSGIDGNRRSLGPSGVVGGEGAYGMVLVGDANVEVGDVLTRSLSLRLSLSLGLSPTPISLSSSLLGALACTE